MKNIFDFYKDTKTKRKTRENILNSASLLFSKNSFESVSMNDVAKKADITHRNLYRYYNNKSDLIVDSFMFYSTANQKPLNFSYNYEKPGIENLESLLLENILVLQKQEFIADVQYIHKFDVFFDTLKKDDPIRKKYVEEYAPLFGKQVKDNLIMCLEKGLEDQSIKNDFGSLEHLYRMIYHTVNSTTLRLLAKKEERNFFSTDILSTTVKVLIQGLKQ